MEFLAKARQSRWYGIVLLAIMAIIVYAVFKILCPTSFGNPSQMITYLEDAIIYAVGGCGMYFIVTMGLWDFSLGSVLVLAELTSIAFSEMFGVIGLVVAPLLTGLILGIINGTAYIKLRIPSLIVTVGLSLVYESFAVIVADWGGARLSSEYKIFGSMPWNVIVAFAAYFLCGFILKYTKMGTYASAIGSNELTAKNMGVNVDKYKFFAFVLCAFFTGIMGILYIGYGTAQTPLTNMSSQSLNFKPLMGTFFGLAFRKYGHPITAIVVGEFMISMMFAGFVALGMPTTINNIVTGLTLLLIVTFTTKRVNGAVVK